MIWWSVNCDILIMRVWYWIIMRSVPSVILASMYFILPAFRFFLESQSLLAFNVFCYCLQFTAISIKIMGNFPVLSFVLEYLFLKFSISHLKKCLDMYIFWLTTYSVVQCQCTGYWQKYMLRVLECLSLSKDLLPSVHNYIWDT